MNERIRNLHENRIFSLLVWLIAIFAAIVMLPNTSTLVQEYGQPQLANNSQPMVASAIQSKWGRNVSNTYNVTAVFNNPSGKLTSKQLAAVDKTMERLAGKESTYGIKDVRTMETNPTAKDQFLSKDGSTEIVKLAVSKNQGSMNLIAKQLDSQIVTTGLNTYVTSPEIINSAASEKISSATTIATVIVFILSLLIIGIVFKSLIAPVISTLSLLMMYAVSLSLINNLASRTSFPYSEYTPLLILLLTVVYGLIGHFYLYRGFKSQLVAGVDRQAAVKNSIRSIRTYMVATGLTLAVIFGGFYLFKFSTLRAMSGLAIVALVTMIGVITISPIFLSLLGDRFFWPAVDGQAKEYGAWNKLAKFGLWQPAIAIVVVAYFVGMFAYSFRDNLNFSAIDTLSTTQNAVAGNKVVAAHFGAGETTPVTIYLQSKDRLDNERALLQIDNLTTKLQTMNGVSSVTSLTQPNGEPISEYYVTNQLNNLNLQLKGATDQLTTIKSDLNSDRSELNAVKLQKEADKISKLASKTSQLSSDTDTVHSQVTQIAGRASVTQRSNASKLVRRYQRLLSLINTQLQTVASNMEVLSSEVSSSQSSAESTQSTVSSYASQLKVIQTSLKKSTTSLTGLISSYTNIYNYLSALQASDAAKVYYITPEQLTSSAFQQSLSTNSSADYKSTAITVYLKQSANSHDTSKTVAHLQSEVNTQLQGTALKNAKVAFTGQPVVQSTIKQSFHHYIVWIAVLVAGIMFIVLAALSRSVLQPLYWLLTYGISVIASFQIGELINRFISGNADFNWQVPLIVMVPVITFGVTQLVELSLDYRHNEAPLLDWLLPGITASGQSFRHRLFGIIVVCLGLLAVNFAPLTQAGLIIIAAVIVFNIVLPIIAAAVGKLTVTLPQHTRKHKETTDKD